MTSNERIKKYLDAGAVLGQVTRARAEEIVRELAGAGDIQREQTQEWVDNLVERSRKTSEQILDLVRHEVATQLKKIDTPALEALAHQVSDLLKRSAEAGRAATADVAAQAQERAQAARTAAKGAAEKVTPTRRKKATPAKKAAPRTAAKKAPAAAKKAAPTAKKAAPAKKTAPAKKAAATKKAAAATTKKATPTRSRTDS
jgi:polyhydroxyalkanoate synthesis regulator phasin